MSFGNRRDEDRMIHQPRIRRVWENPARSFTPRQSYGWRHSSRSGSEWRASMFGKQPAVTMMRNTESCGPIRLTLGARSRVSVKDANGHVYRIVGIAEDVTERKRPSSCFKRSEIWARP